MTAPCHYDYTVSVIYGKDTLVPVIVGNKFVVYFYNVIGTDFLKGACPFYVGKYISFLIGERFENVLAYSYERYVFPLEILWGKSRHCGKIILPVVFFLPVAFAEHISAEI